MNQQVYIPMAGLLRVVYFIALASALAILIIGGISNIYSGPSEDSELTNEFTSLFTNPEQEDYHRNLGIIFAILGVGLMGAAIIGFRANQNALRCGLLAAGLIVFWAAVGYASSGSSDWLISVWALLAVVVLAGANGYLPDGADLGAIRGAPPAA